MNYCFLARGGLKVFSPKMFLDIRNRYDKDAEGIFIVTTDQERTQVESLVSNGHVYNLSDYMKEHWPTFEVNQLTEYERKYECAPIWQYIYTDRFLIERDYEYTVKTTIGLFSFFEYIFDKHRINVYYSETIATLLCYVAYLVGLKKGVKYISQTGARGLDSTHHYNIDEPMQYMMGLNENYQNEVYLDDEIKKADAFLTEFESKEIIPAYMTFTGKRPRFKAEFLLLPIKRFLCHFKEKYNSPYSYITYKSEKYITDPLKFYLRYQRCKKYYNKADYNQKFVYYPLHFQPEASTCVCAQKYEKQLFFIDSWAKSLPADTLLYVKEHYAILGHRDPQFYKELKKYPNVVLIDPWESSRSLMQSAVAVTTLTGTAGWEAMLLRKPVFIGGNIFFDKGPGIIKIDDMYGNYLKNIETWKQPSREILLKYLCSYFRAIRPGCSYGYGSLSDNDDNIKLIVDSFIKEASK